MDGGLRPFQSRFSPSQMVISSARARICALRHLPSLNTVTIPAFFSFPSMFMIMGRPGIPMRDCSKELVKIG